MAQIEEKQSNDGGKVRAKKQSTAVDMTPLADLGFLLITFFMFTTTFSKPNVMSLNMPPKTPPVDKPQNTPDIDVSNSISIILGGENKLFWHQEDKTKLVAADLNETEYTKEGIRQVILDAKKRAKTPDNFTVIIKPSDDSTYENLVNILDEMEITESQRYGIVDIAPNEVKVYEEKSGISSNN
jgi:biopolymer transport protein ExbD